MGQGKNGSVSFIVKDPEKFKYYCEYHESTMNGQLVVIPKGWMFYLFLAVTNYKFRL